MDIREVGVIGLGTMGAGIAEVFARGGLAVTAVEADAAALDRGMAALNGSLARAVSRGRLSGDEQARIAARVSPGTALGSLAGADLVVEVVPERLAIKRQVLADLDRICRPDAVIATNTSSLSVTAIAAGSARPGRVVGMHFFNPAPVMALVEVVTTVLTDQAVAQAVTDLARHLGKTPVRVADRAGFVANALLLPYLNHAVRLLETGYATREDIDAAATVGIGLPMGPLALLDLIGLDTSLAILEVLDREFGGTRCTPAPLLRRLAAAGRTGRKGGGGFYDYPPPASATGGSPDGDNADQHLPPGTVTLIDGGEAADDGDGAGSELAGLIAAAGVNLTRNPVHASDLVVVATGPAGGVLGPALAAARAADAVGLHLVTPSLAELVTTPLASAAALASARALLARLGLRVVRCPDRPGLLVGALLYPHLRDAVVMVADGYASPADVDAAMTLGCGYPRGPMRLLAEAGPRQAVGVLAAMHAGYGDPAFAPPPLLTEFAAAGLALGR
ncbi:MAG TPA: 3-hydroxyacyl-CoA dehydrogenase NAD-binding domain-containing protein [Streptosporangiaceae bacterium]|nr:3-hydroxyacyl-CoA dehydrogenase NAD-binding domain-containing protein [Streptosporangiaceae bacterium]